MMTHVAAKFFMLAIAGLSVASLANAQADGATEQTLEPTVVEDKSDAKSEGGLAGSACTNGKNRRLVEIKTGAPCSVHYRKETEQPGHDQVIYNAQNDPNYCATKAAAFVQKLEGMGWSCAKL